MSIEHLDKTRLINLEYSLFKEVLRTNRAGAYSSSSIIGCNTRKYHGLLVAPIEELDNERHVLLSSLDVSVVQHNKSFNLGIHKYGGSHYEPKGHKYMRDYELYPIPKATYRVGGVVLKQELVLVEQTSQVLLRYTLLEAKSETKLRLKPFLAFRHIHDLTRQNLNANTRYASVDNGISLCLYKGFPSLFMQVSSDNEFVANPDWYRDIEYLKEEHRGYNFVEDLYVPGYFEFDISKGESIVFAAGTEMSAVKGLKAKFTREAKKRVPRNGLLNNLLNAAQQFIICNGKECKLMAGYHWYGPRLRDTLVALPGLTVFQEDKSNFAAILDSAVKDIKKEYLENDLFAAKDIDVPLWLFWTLQKCIDYCGVADLWEQFGPVLKDILNLYRNLQTEQCHLTSKGLIYAKVENVPLTWMNAIVDNQPITPRYGMPVEVNALWYNALMFSLDLAKANGDSNFVDEWQALAESVGKAFIQTYWMEDVAYLKDSVDGDSWEMEIRPNQIIATALPYSPLNLDQKKAIVDVVKKELLTPKGIRSLSPQDPKYKGVMEGDVRQRDLSLHQGTVFPWLVSFFIDTYLFVHKRGGLTFVQRLLEEYERELGEHCLGTISEAYNGNPPHTAKGSVSMAWNVAGILRVLKELETYE
ncbi:glycogen debranching enzyme N-terminal domain-containing protein [Carboxylicivirga sp. N1Y90]|uniref:glycogen debranching enzyme N-terminal domain-containing protein n=1 Tax=Carboxylicivirga fragile TaxID=3417571 RepID=UPI003D3248E1|nr:glycogen debranching enzyme N-terminal domain-containing protein [Marinilabiliaceae bacterium N1Y90]